MLPASPRRATGARSGLLAALDQFLSTWTPGHLRGPPAGRSGPVAQGWALSLPPALLIADPTAPQVVGWFGAFCL